MSAVAHLRVREASHTVTVPAAVSSFLSSWLSRTAPTTTAATRTSAATTSAMTRLRLRRRSASSFQSASRDGRRIAAVGAAPMTAVRSASLSTGVASTCWPANARSRSLRISAADW